MATLRRAVPADAADLTRLRGLMHLAMGDQPSPEWQARCEADLRRRLATDSFAAYVVQDQRIVSGGAGWLEEHLPSPYQLDGRRGHIASMSTEPGARRRGYGRLVFKALMGWFCHDLGVTRIDLRATPDGQPLYEQFGFRVLGGSTMAWTAPGSRPGMGGHDT